LKEKIGDPEMEIRIDYQTYHYQWRPVFAENEQDAERIISGLKKLKHITGIKVKNKRYL
jgi:hypothetical protein